MVRPKKQSWVMGGDDDERTIELKKKLSARMEDEGFNSIKDFMRKTKVPFSPETVRRAFNECDYKNLEASTLAVILKYLNYTPNEIKHILTEYTDDHDLVELIGDTNVEYDMYEQRLVDAYRIVVKADKELSVVIADQIELVARVARVKVAQFTDGLRR